MRNVVFKRGTKAGLENLPIEDGSFILTKNGQIFMDVGEERVSVSPEMATDDDVVAMFAQTKLVLGDPTAEDTGSTESGSDNSNSGQDGTTTIEIEGTDNPEVSEF